MEHHPLKHTGQSGFACFVAGSVAQSIDDPETSSQR
jgi:hypothetical protein